MAEVWVADDLELDRPVALKLLAPAADPVRFEREARAAAALSHPNIRKVYDYGETAGRPFLALEYLPGGTLEERLAGGAVPHEETDQIARDLADGLAHAHRHGLVHRDLKPANVIFDAEGRAKIADFGIARLYDAGTLTEAGTVLGTAAYIAPEQAAGLPASPASDVYSFGVILYRMLAGRLPFEADTPVELAAKHRDEQPPALRTFRPNVPALLEGVALAALAKSPHDRPPDGAALVAELGRGGGHAAETQITQVLRHPAPRRRRALAALGGVVVLGAGAGAAVLATRDDSASPRRPAPRPLRPVLATAPPAPTASTAPPVTASPAMATATTAARTSAPAPPRHPRPVTEKRPPSPAPPPPAPPPPSPASPPPAPPPPSPGAPPPPALTTVEATSIGVAPEPPPPPTEPETTDTTFTDTTATETLTATTETTPATTAG